MHYSLQDREVRIWEGGVGGVYILFLRGAMAGCKMSSRLGT